MRTRILTEARANRHAWDVVSFNLLDIDALSAKACSPPTRLRRPAVAIRAGAVDPQGRWAAIYVRQYVIGYNTRLGEAGEPPPSWSDLLEPSWAGKLAIDESDVEWYAAMLDYWGRDKGVAFMRALARQKPQQRRGHQLLTRLLVAGDFPLALVHADEIEKEKQEGAPVEWVRSLDPVIDLAQPGRHRRQGAASGGGAPLRRFPPFERRAARYQAARGRVPARSDLGTRPARR